MDSTLWQWVIVGAAVLASAVYVGLRVWRLLRPGRSDTSCGECHGCGSQSAKPLVTLRPSTGPRVGNETRE
jgi:hypothetical protein